MPKHRRSEIEPSLTPAGGPVTTAEFWPEPAGYGHVGPEPGWTAAPEEQPWEEWRDWQDWGPPPALHPDHPSAPVPRVRFPADQPSGPLPAARAPSLPDLPQRRPGGRAATWNSPDAGYDYGRETGQLRPAPGHGLSQNDYFPGRDVLWTAGQVLTQADNQAAQIAQEAHDYAAAVREAAEREATAITRQAAAVREAAEREAVEGQARLDSMSGELRRVAAYVAESLAATTMPGAAPALPAPGPALPGARPALPRTGSAVLPATKPARPAPKPARPATRPGIGPGRPGTVPAGKPQKQPRQRRAMRFVTCATAAMVLFAVICGATEVGLHGFKFFVFRGGGVGETSGTQTDQQFLARQAAAAHHVVAPKARHHGKSHKTDQ